MTSLAPTAGVAPHSPAPTRVPICRLFCLFLSLSTDLQECEPASQEACTSPSLTDKMDICGKSTFHVHAAFSYLALCVAMALQGSD